MILQWSSLNSRWQHSTDQTASGCHKKRDKKLIYLQLLTWSFMFLWLSPSKFPFLTGHEDWNDLKNQFTWKRQCLKSTYMSTANKQQKKAWLKLSMGMKLSLDLSRDQPMTRLWCLHIITSPAPVCFSQGPVNTTQPIPTPPREHRLTEEAINTDISASWKFS